MEILEQILEWLQANPQAITSVLTILITLICRALPRKADKDRKKQINDLKAKLEEELKK